MAADDLFVWLDALWTKARPEGTFPQFVAHRFLASHRDLADAARVLWRDVREPALVFLTWQGLLPRGAGAPKLTYPAPKKAPEAEALTLRMMTVLHVRRAVVEEMQAVIERTGRFRELYTEFGIAPPVVEAEPEEETPRPRRGKKKPPPPAAGILGHLE